MRLQIDFVAESELTGDERNAIGAAMPQRWIDRFPLARVRAYCHRAPVYRLVATGDGAVVGSQSVFDLRVHEPVFGLGDLVVHPDVQRRGIARALITLAVSDLQARVDAPIVTGSRHAYLRRMFETLGFTPPPPGALRTVPGLAVGNAVGSPRTPRDHRALLTHCSLTGQAETQRGNVSESADLAMLDIVDHQLAAQ